MNLRFNRRNPGEESQQENRKPTKMPPKRKNPKAKKIARKTKQVYSKKTNQIDDSPVPEDVLNILLERFFPAQEEKKTRTAESEDSKKKDPVVGSDDSEQVAESEDSEKESSDEEWSIQSSDEEWNRVRESGRKGKKKTPMTRSIMRKRGEEVRVVTGEIGDSTPQPRQRDERSKTRKRGEEVRVVTGETGDSTPQPRQRGERSKMRKRGEEVRVVTGETGDSTPQPRQRDERSKMRKRGEEVRVVTGETGDSTPQPRQRDERSKMRKRGEEVRVVTGETGDSTPQPRQRDEESGDVAIEEIEEEPGIVTLNFGAHNYQGCGETNNTRSVKPSSMNSSKKRKGRGIAIMPDLKEDANGVRMVVQYNSKDQPTGHVAIKLSSFLGLLARMMVPIHYENWLKVPMELKETLLKHVENKYVIDSRKRKGVLVAISNSWRAFKTTLTTSFITPLKDQPELLSCPPEPYNFIKQEHWDAFVRSRLSEEFQKRSKRNSEIRAKLKYIHRLGRRSYAGLLEEVKQNLGDSVDELDRCVLWKKARQNKDGSYIDDDVREKAELIDELIKQKECGSLVIQGSKDILTLALGTPEKSERVRSVGLGHYVTPKTYFSSSKCNSEKYVGELEKKVDHQANIILEMSQTTKELQARLDGMSSQGPATIPPSEKISNNTDKSDNRKHLTNANDDYPLPIDFETAYQSTVRGNTESCISPPNVNSRVGKTEQCRLAVDSKANIVARGMVFERVESNEKIHNVPLGESNIRVAIEFAISPNTLLPVPVIGEMTMVKDAIGSCVAWPKEFVLTGLEEEKNQAAEEKSGPIQAFANFLDQILPTDNVIIPIPNVIFEEEADAHLLKADMMYLCNMQEITASCITTYIRLLCGNVANYQELYGFINPASISYARGPDAPSIIAKRLHTARKDQLFFVPYNTGGHWVLIVIDSSSMDVYWLDPMQKPPSMTVKIYVTTGLKAFQTDGKRRPNPTWHCIKCPKQPLEVQCGYYVMRYMRELMQETNQPLAEKVLRLAENNTYLQDQVDEVRLELIDFILTHL